MAEQEGGYQPSADEVQRAESMMTDQQKEQSKIREEFRKENKTAWDDYGLKELARGEEDAEKKIDALLKVLPQVFDWRDAGGRGYSPDAEVKSIGTGIFASELSDFPGDPDRAQKWEKRVTEVQDEFRKTGIKSVTFPCFQRGSDISMGEVTDDVFRPEIVVAGNNGEELVYKGNPRTIRELSKRLGYSHPEERAFFDKMYAKAQIKANLAAYRNIEKFLQDKGAL